MDAATLYSQIKTYASLGDTTICCLHKSKPNLSCIDDSQNNCKNPSQTKVIDFDAVKVLYCQQNKVSPQPTSVDAIAHKQHIFVFVEIKSNKNFLTKQLNKPDDTVDAVDRKIKEQVKNYNLIGKINDSIEICKEIVNDKNLFDRVAFVYVLVTDINTLTNPMQVFQAQLNAAAYKTININHLLKLNNAISENLKSSKHPNRYVYCKDFDNFMATL